MYSIYGTPAYFVGGGDLLYLFFLVAHLVLCYMVGKYAESRGSSFWLGALLSFFTSPLIGFLVVALIGGQRIRR